MSTYSPSPRTANEAAIEERKRLSKERNKASEKAQAYSRLIANTDFTILIAELRKHFAPSTTSSPLSDFEQGRNSAWDVIVRELNYSQAAAKFIAELTAKELENLHSKMLHVEQKGNEG
jgi:hypothetical protein